MSATDNPISFEQQIKPLFRERDRQSMKWAFDLWSRDDVAGNSEAILATPPRGHDALRWRLVRRADRGLSRLGRDGSARIIGDRGRWRAAQASDRLEGEFTEQDEANLVRLAALTSTALDALAQLHLPDYRRKVAGRSSARRRTSRLIEAVPSRARRD